MPSVEVFGKIADMSLPVRGAWIEIFVRGDADQREESLPVRGAWIEMLSLSLTIDDISSLPVRGAWIEIRRRFRATRSRRCRSPCGERGLKYKLTDTIKNIDSRSPCGERGLKSIYRERNADCCIRRSPCGERGLKLGDFQRMLDEHWVAPRAGSVD